MTAVSPPHDDTRLPSYSEAIAWGVVPPPRPQWAPPREQPSSSSSRLQRARPARPFSMGNIDATLANAVALRPQSSNAAAADRSLSILDLSLDAVLRGESPRADLRRSPISPRRPMSAQGFLSFARPSSPRPSLLRSASPVSSPPGSPHPDHHHDHNNNNNHNTSAVPPPPPAIDEVVIPAAIPLHQRPAVPPIYEPLDPIARTYLMRTPLIYSSTGSSPQTPAYQLDAQLTKAGRPYQLRIRPLDHIESRTLSLRGDGAHSDPDVGYDDDHTLYLLQVMQLLGGLGVPGLGFGPSWRVEMRRAPKGGSSRNLSLIRFEGGGFLGLGPSGGGSSSSNGRRSGGRLGGGRKSGSSGGGGAAGGLLSRSCKFWYMTKKTDRELKRAHEWKLMNRYGYSPEYDWNKRLLFTVKRKVALGKNRGFEWKDGKGRLVAVETAEGRLDLTNLAASMSAHSREALLACWVGKAWAAGALIW